MLRGCLTLGSDLFVFSHTIQSREGLGCLCDAIVYQIYPCEKLRDSDAHQLLHAGTTSQGAFMPTKYPQKYSDSGRQWLTPVKRKSAKEVA